MYIWIGCQLPEAFEAAVRQRCLRENKTVGLNTAALSLPQHISLKISFPTDRREAILAWLQEYLRQQPAFTVTMKRIEQIPGVLWLSVEENCVLEALHSQLDTLLLEKFDVPQHPFDREFRFHSTLFLDSDGEKLTAMAQAIQDLPLPQTLQVDTFLLGTSKDGTAGDYSIAAKIPAKQV